MSALIAARVLTAEDDPVARADLRLMLEDAGFDVCPDARDGVEAVELARVHQPDLILIDLTLARIDGVEATRRILHERDVPIVALAGHRTGSLVERAIEAGAVAHVLKPVREAHLIGTIEGALADRASREERDAEASAEAERRYQLVMVESMVREGFSQREISDALRRAYGWRHFGTALAFSRRIRALFAR